MNITSAQYTKNESGKNAAISIVVAGVTWSVPLDSENSDYIEIKKQVDAGTLTIKDAE